jgi:hypothetical protein
VRRAPTTRKGFGIVSPWAALWLAQGRFFRSAHELFFFSFLTPTRLLDIFIFLNEFQLNSFADAFARKNSSSTDPHKTKKIETTAND